jgi:hypothetical protein
MDKSCGQRVNNAPARGTRKWFTPIPHTKAVHLRFSLGRAVISWDWVRAGGQPPYRAARHNGLAPEVWLTATIDRMAKCHPVDRLDELLPWNWPGQAVQSPA